MCGSMCPLAGMHGVGGPTDMVMVTPQRSRSGMNACRAFGGASKFEEFFDHVMGGGARCVGD